MGIDAQWELVREFHRKFGHPAPAEPIMIARERAEKRHSWMLEEINEFLDARTIADQADAMIDLIYFALGTLVEMGVKPEELFDIVHNANMQKLWEDGKPRWNKDGKTIKPAGWKDPYELIAQAIMGKNAD
ncbi:MAG: hypothetical protein LBU32_14095 [Clostridiales bacterium]|jgi:predicted HAD superfamily Cof-like phosphohydrolase|nr:hypothetical protein [Clostridiales bacterium]